MRQRAFVILVLAAASSPPVASMPLAAQQQTITRLDGRKVSPNQVDALMTGLMKTAHIEGAGVAIINDGRLTFVKAYGSRDIAKHLALTPDSVMTAASLTKAAFATMVMQLVAEKTINLDRPVHEYLPKPLPECPGYEDLASDLRYKLITMRMLLSHSSGFPNLRRFTDDKKLRIYFAPGSRFAYSGEGMELAQMIVEAVTHQTTENLMRKRIFQTAGMTRTSMIWRPEFEEDYANGYDEQGVSLGAQRRRRADAAGSMQTTLRDYAKLVQAVMDGRLLPLAERSEMLRPQVAIHSRHQFPTLVTETTTQNDGIELSYGLGWGLYRSSYGPVFFKEGHDDGWRNYAVCFEDTKTAIVIMTNSSNGEDIYSGVLQELLGKTSTPLAWEGYKPPAPAAQSQR